MTGRMILPVTVVYLSVKQPILISGIQVGVGVQDVVLYSDSYLEA